MVLMQLHALAIVVALCSGQLIWLLPSLGAPSGAPSPALEVDTGAAGTDKFPVWESDGPNNAAGSISSPSVSLPGNQSGTIDPNADALPGPGISGKSPCLPRQSARPSAIPIRPARRAGAEFLVQAGRINPSSCITIKASCVLWRLKIKVSFCECRVSKYF